MLTCIVECSPLCSISWYRNQSLITNSTVFKVTDIARHVYVQYRTQYSTVNSTRCQTIPTLIVVRHLYSLCCSY